MTVICRYPICCVAVYPQMDKNHGISLSDLANFIADLLLRILPHSQVLWQRHISDSVARTPHVCGGSG